MRRLFAWVSPCLLFVGCAGLEDRHYTFVNEYRANVAWHAADYDKHEVRCFSDFGYGWRTGYFDVSIGRFGRTPAIPPKKYWAASYQAGDGPAAINAWYQGYQAGAIAAERDGYGALHVLPAYGTASHGSLPPSGYVEQSSEPTPPPATAPTPKPEEVTPPAPPMPPPPSEVQGASWTSIYSGGIAGAKQRRLPLSATAGGVAEPQLIEAGPSTAASSPSAGNLTASSALEPLPPTTVAEDPNRSTILR